MPNKPLRPCRHPGCSKLVRDGYCPEHQPPRMERGESAQWHGWYSLSIWTDDLRPTQLMLEPWCRECAKRGLRVRAVAVDHVVPHRGNWSKFVDRQNLQSLCERCHNRKTAIEMAEDRRRSRLRR